MHGDAIAPIRGITASSLSTPTVAIRASVSTLPIIARALVASMVCKRIPADTVPLASLGLPFEFKGDFGSYGAVGKYGRTLARQRATSQNPPPSVEVNSNVQSRPASMIACANRSGLEKQSSWLPRTCTSRNRPNFSESRGCHPNECGKEMSSVQLTYDFAVFM